MTSATPTIAVAKPATVVTLSCSSNSTAASIAESAGTRKNKLETLAAARCWRSHNMVSTGLDKKKKEHQRFTEGKFEAIMFVEATLRGALARMTQA